MKLFVINDGLYQTTRNMEPTNQPQSDELTDLEKATQEVASCYTAHMKLTNDAKAAAILTQASVARAAGNGATEFMVSFMETFEAEMAN